MLKPKSRWRNQFTIVEGNSKFHEKVRQIFVSDTFFKNLSCYQEVAVASLCPNYGNNAHRIDWYIEELGVIIELHGRQHYEMTNFGNTSFEEARKQFHNGQYRDNKKKTALIEAGFIYIEIPYKDEKKLSGEYLAEVIFYDDEDE